MSKSFIKSFGVNAMERLKRTRFKHHDTRDLTLAPGWLVPVYCRDVIPSDVWNAKEINVQVKQVLESLKPTFGDVYLSLFYFFVPYRLLWKKWQDIFGLGKPSEWDNPVETVLPQFNFRPTESGSGVTLKPTTGNGYDAMVNTSVGSSGSTPTLYSVRYNLLDYLGYGHTVFGGSAQNIKVNLMHPAAYLRIWTDFFRNENVQEPDPDCEKIYNFSGSGSLDIRLGLHYAGKLKDVYTSVLPSPQKGAPVTVSVGESAPVYLRNDGNSLSIGTNQTFQLKATGAADPGETTAAIASATSGSGTYAGTAAIFADLSNAIGATVNEVRFDFAMQRMKERDARGGTRYNEVLLSTFEAYNGDITLGRPELLGGDTIQLNMTTVPSTGANPGKLGGMSNTNASTRPFVKTFGEFGVLMAVATIRPRKMYSQGVPKFASKYRRYHWYDPALQHVGDQPISTKEIYAPAGDSQVFGFQEAWYEYRSDENIVCADMRGGTADMDAWSYVEKFTSQPYLNSDFVAEKGGSIIKTLVGFNNSYPGYVYAMHIDFHMEVTSPMQPHSIPGLIDHIM